MRNKIAFISEHASPLATLGSTDSGGQNVYVTELALQLAQMGYSIDIFTRREDPLQDEIYQLSPHVRVIQVTAGPVRVLAKEKLLAYMPAFRTQMEIFIAAQKIDYQLIHAHFWMSGLVAMELKEKLDIPFLITFHALGYLRKRYQGSTDKFPPERIEIERQIVSKADKIIAECPQDEADLIRWYQADAARIEVIPCGYNPSHFYPLDRNDCKERLGIEQSTQVVLQLGRMVPRKGIDTVIEGFALIDHSKPRLLVIVGGNPDLEEDQRELQRLKELALKLGVTDRVLFAGQKSRDELKYYYGAAQFFVTTPWYEPFGITPLEAMACARPVIGARVGGIKFSVIDGETGYLVEPKKPLDLARRMESLMADDDMCGKMGRKAARHVSENFLWQQIAGKMARCYLEISTKHTQARRMELEMIETAFEQAAETFRKSASQLSQHISRAGMIMAKSLEAGNKILVCGNGGSAAESQHFVAELIGRFELAQRRGLPAISLNSDMAVITAWANDFGYDDIFARQVQALGKQGDILLSMSTSGNSANVVKAVQMALKKGMTCINMLGNDGGKTLQYGHVNLLIPSDSTQRIQEMHLHLIHLLCTIIEERLFSVAYTGRIMAKERSLVVVDSHADRLSSYGLGINKAGSYGQ